MDATAAATIHSFSLKQENYSPYPHTSFVGFHLVKLLSTSTK